MRRTALIPLLAMALALFAAPAFAGPGFDVGARAYYWFPELTGNVQTTLGGITDNTTFDVKDDLIALCTAAAHRCFRAVVRVPEAHAERAFG